MKGEESKQFCIVRGLPVSSKRNDELVAFAFAAAVQKLPVVLTKAEEREIVKRDDAALLTFDSSCIPHS